MKPTFEVIDLTNHNDKKDLRWGKTAMPYMHVWLHCPQGSYLIKGYAHTVDYYIKIHFPINIHKRKYFGPLRTPKDNEWHFDGVRCNIDSPGKFGFWTNKWQRKYTFAVFDLKATTKARDSRYKTVLQLKRIPNKWIPEYDMIVNLLKEN